jgi:hypothetical protein
VELHYKITSLPPNQATAADLLQLSRGHWSIENQLHYVRDVTLGEDASRIRTGVAPQVMAAIRNLIIAILRVAGNTNLASGLRHFAWQPDQAIRCLGLLQPGTISDAIRAA